MKVDMKTVVGTCAAGVAFMAGVPVFAEEVPEIVVNERIVDQDLEDVKEASQEIPELIKEEEVSKEAGSKVDVDEGAVVLEDGEGTAYEETEAPVPSVAAMAIQEEASDLKAMTDDEMMALFRKYIGEDDWDDDYGYVFRDRFLDDITDSDVQSVTVGSTTYSKVSDDSKIDEQIAKAISFIRELNGLSSVTVSDEYDHYAQEAVDYLAENDLDIDHYAADGIIGAEDAKKGLHGSNLAQGYYSNMMEMVGQLFGDDDAYNRTILGHRAWLLDPTLTTIGVGYAKRSDETELLAVYVQESSDTRNKEVKETVQYVWPNSGRCAYELLSETACSSTMPWSIALGSDYEDHLTARPDALDDLKITITDENGKEYTIDTNIDDVSDPDTNYKTFGDWFTAETIYSSQIGYLRIGFNPGSMYKDHVFEDNGDGTYSQKGYSALKGHSFTVRVEGLEDDIEYTVDFVSMVEMIEGSKEAKEIVDNVERLIDDIDENVTADSKDAVDKALEAYNKLTDAQKRLIDPSKATKLNEAKTACDDAVKEAASAQKAIGAIEKIDAIPDDVDLDCADEVLAAKQAYDALDADTKAYLQGKAQYAKLTGADRTLLDICANALSNVNDLIDGIPDAITADDEKAIVYARTAYDGLPIYDIDYKTKVASSRASKLGNAESTVIILKKEASDRAASRSVDDKITALPEKDDVSLADETAITDARTAYDTLTEDQKAYVTSYSKLTDAEIKIEELKARQKADRDAADEVSALIGALPDGPSLNDKAEVDSIYTKYQALSDVQRSLVSKDDHDKLVSLKEAVDSLYDDYLSDKASADAVIGKIDRLPTIVTVDDEILISEARTAYDALDRSSKAMIGEAAVRKLTEAEDALVQSKRIAKDKAEAAKAAVLIGALPETITDDDIDAVEAAGDAYDVLTDDQRSYISADVKAVLDDARTAASEIKKQMEADVKKASEVGSVINGLKRPADMAYGDCEAVRSAKDAYDALSDKQKDLVSESTKTILTNAIDKANELIEKHNADVLKANGVIDLIDALSENITVDDESDVNKAVSAYDALTEGQKALVSGSALNKLNGSVEGLRIAKVKARADEVTELIEALPETILLKDETAIEDAAKACDDLTEEGKAFVSKEAIEKLANAQKVLDQAKEDASNQEKAGAANKAIEDLPGEIVLENEDAVKNARSLYDALTAAQKLYVPEALFIKLTDAERSIAEAYKVLNDKARAKEVTDLIGGIPENITGKDLTSIQAVGSAYDALTDEQKAYVSADDKKRLDDSIEAVNTAVRKAIDDIEAAARAENIICELKAFNNMTYADSNAAYEAKGAYDALTDDQKELLSENIKTFLTNVLSKADALVKKHGEDVAEAGKVTGLIDALPEDITLDDEAAVKDARSAYDALTDDQKEFVSTDTVDKLNICTDSLKVVKDRAAADAAVEKIDRIRTGTTCDDEAAINDAVNAYDSLNDDAKALVGYDKVQMLKDAVKALDEAKAVKVDQEAAAEITDQIADIPKDVTLKNKRIVLLALAGYKDLTAIQKMYISDDDVAKLTDAVNKIDKLEAGAVEGQFEDLPDAEDIVLDDDDLILKLRDAYDALSDGSKAVFDEDLLKRLEDAQIKIAAVKQEKADKESAEQVCDLIEALKDPEDLTIDDKNAVYTIYQTYRNMTAEAMAILSQYDREKIEGCYERMNALVEGNKIAEAVGIDASPDTGIETKDLTLMMSALLGLIGIGAAGMFVKDMRGRK